MGFWNLLHKIKAVESAKSGIAKEEDRIASLEAQLEEQRKKDCLTGLLNRPAFSAHLKEIEEKVIRPGILLIDIDGMRFVNSRFGYGTGDRILEEMSGLLCYCTPDAGMVARIDGDIFAIFFDEADKALISEVGSRILFSVRELKAENMGIENKDYKIRVSIGSSLWDGKTQFDRNILVEQAMVALAEAKKNGRDQQIEFSDNRVLFSRMQAEKQARIDIEFGMNRALGEGEFVPVFQPQYDIDSGAIVGLEMLARWHHPVKGVLQPSYFLSTFERNHFIIELDLYMFERACQILKKWEQEKKPLVPISCNFSGLHCHNPFWVVQLVQTVKKYRVPPALLKIELGEDALQEERDRMSSQIAKLREEGFLVSLQSFSAAFSSIGILQEVPVDGIKLAQNIIMNDFSQENNQMIFSGILSISRMLQFKVYCVGVETKKQEQIIKKHGCSLVQGDYYSPPLSLSEVEELVAKNREQTKKRSQHVYHAKEGEAYLGEFLDRCYVKKDMGWLEDKISGQIEWRDLFSGEETLIGLEQWKNYMENDIMGRRFQVELFFCRVCPESAGSFAVTGEGRIIEKKGGKDIPHRFCIYMESLKKEEGVKVERLDMVRIYGSLESHLNEEQDLSKKPAKMRQEYEQLDSLYGRLPIGITRYDNETDLMVTYMNDTMLQILGYEREEFFHGELKGNIRSLVYPEEVSMVYGKAYHLMRVGEEGSIEFHYVKKDGSIVRVRQYQYNVIGVSGRAETQTVCIPVPEPIER